MLLSLLLKFPLGLHRISAGLVSFLLLSYTGVAFSGWEPSGSDLL